MPHAELRGDGVSGRVEGMVEECVPGSIREC